MVVVAPVGWRQLGEGTPAAAFWRQFGGGGSRVATAWRRQRNGSNGGSFMAAVVAAGGFCSLAQAARQWQLGRGSSATEQVQGRQRRQLGSVIGSSLAAEWQQQVAAAAAHDRAWALAAAAVTAAMAAWWRWQRQLNGGAMAAAGWQMP